MTESKNFACSLCGHKDTLEPLFHHLEKDHGVVPTPISYVDGDGMLMRFHLESGVVIYYDISQDFDQLKAELAKRIEQLKKEENNQ